MRTRTDRTGCRASGGRLLKLCAVCVLVLASGTVGAADGSGPGGAVIEERDTSNEPRSLSLLGPETIIDETASAFAPMATCNSTLLPSNAATSGNGRAPIANYRGIRTVYLITAAELAANGLPSGAVPSGIGWRYSTAPGVVASGTLTVYLQNTTDETYQKGTSFAAAIGAMTTVHNATTSLPNSTTPFDIPFVGGSTFTYTGGGLYVAFDWRYFIGTLGLGAVDCNNTLPNGLASSQTTATPPTGDLLTANSFRPMTRLTLSINNDVSVDYVISYGALAKPLVGPQTVQAVVTNKGVNAQANLPVTFNLTGAETFTDTKVVPALAGCGGQTVVTFQPFTPSAIGTDSVTISVPADDAGTNNSKSRPLDETFNLYSYKHPGTTAAGGVGVTGNTADFVGKFAIAAAAKVSAVTIEFPAANPTTTYRVAVYPDSGSGTPGLVPLYEDALDRLGPGAAGPVTITLPSPVAVGPGIFFAGVQQTNTVNIGIGYDVETPIRAGSFYLASPHPAASWVDLAPGNNFKLNIGVTLVQCASVAECNDNNACTNDACTNNLCVHTNNNQTSCDGNSCSNPDSCVNGTCIPGPNPCNDNNTCTVDLCDGQGACLYDPLDCDDNNACTNDFCIPGSGCAHNNNVAACSDSNPCTIGDTCSGGACVPGSAPLPAPVLFCSNDAITIPLVGTATPYPSSIVVTGQPSYVCSATVNLSGITHTYPDDIDVLLARLSGSNAIVMSDVGGGNPAMSVNLTLNDAAASGIADTGPVVSGTFKPTNFTGTGTETWAAPAPAPSGGSALSAFTGTNPNGTWNLWVVDDESPDGGSFSGWCVNLVSICLAAADCDDGNPCTDDSCDERPLHARQQREPVQRQQRLHVDRCVQRRRLRRRGAARLRRRQRLHRERLQPGVRVVRESAARLQRRQHVHGRLLRHGSGVRLRAERQQHVLGQQPVHVPRRLPERGVRGAEPGRVRPRRERLHDGGLRSGDGHLRLDQQHERVRRRGCLHDGGRLRADVRRELRRRDRTEPARQLDVLGGVRNGRAVVDGRHELRHGAELGLRLRRGGRVR